MITLGLILIGLSFADLVAGGLAGEPVDRRRVALGLAGGVSLVVAAAWWLSGLGAQSAWTVAATALLTAGWLAAKSAGGATSWSRPRLALVILGLGLAVGLGASRDSGLANPLDAWLADSPFPLLASSTSGRVVLLFGVLLFLTAPANGVIRAVLTMAGTPWRRSETRLRGGRLIGVLERWLIFGLAVAGEPTAAALIVSAKGLLRFPELNRTAQQAGPLEPNGDLARPAEIDEITEYFLLGSLLSWTLALAPVLLLGTP